MEYKIDTNIPLPAMGPGSGPQLGWSDKYELSKRKHGESMWFAKWQPAKNVYSAAYRRWRVGRITVKPCMRSVGADDPEGAGYRVWFLDPNEAEHGNHS